MKKVLITGGNGQLGNQFRQQAGENKDLLYHFIDIDELDLTDEAQVTRFFTENRFDAIVNCAAFTNVDGAEDHEEEARQLNAGLVRILALEAKKAGTLLVHISTDYVFNGKSHKPYTEEDATGPDSVYGKTKLMGEEELKKISGNTAIVRTSWLISAFGHNFLKTIDRLSRERETLKVVFDQVGAPTYAGDLVMAINEIIRQRDSRQGVGIYNFSNEGVCSWYDLAVTITELNGSGCMVYPVRSSEYPQKAPRPPFSILDKKKIKEELNITIPHWRVSLEKAMNELSKNKQQ